MLRHEVLRLTSLPLILILILSNLLGHALTALTSPSPGLPMVINTWGGPFTAATDAAYQALISPDSTSALDAVEIGCSTCERNQCDGSVGYGGSPDEACETTLDAMIMDGTTLKSGAVAALRRVREAVSVARAVLEHTTHTLLAGDQATLFAVQNGFLEQNLTTEASARQCAEWRAADCQANYRINVTPDPTTACGPYTPLAVVERRDAALAGGDAAAAAAAVHRRDAYPDALQRGFTPASASQASHDTISMIAIHSSGTMAAGTSTNGASHKIPGRVGDGPITGSGSYVDGDVGGCGATGDGDIMMRFLPCYQAVENLRQGMTPTEAAEDVVKRMLRKYPEVASGIVVVNNNGEHGGAGSGWTFTYAYRGGDMNATEVVTVPPVSVSKDFV
ncbi:putative n -(beta-n-acetylglucosaminyl)-l-asparaginase protein [Phaeoacremonium minimum UCRPA7]|uniref:Putative n-(Beta-n-acetylglucosaminyl)-l-asparaginase protein n=1 Tax=Phaeoacremonium minimum (strain UCR-PA7) TaxID=1286976 RepID=R8B9U5_PHAM7|nr:putative n -(beta-n-acetylglucosaminyl)-l-asparaginase protein [Phaeoacremonium minimum UCRPA7]EON96089.1 putative n -(beta-n-acetylglucosaminyl)-l-asparaginase protein [Phaeoacremonium minimum UCRPA7]